MAVAGATATRARALGVLWRFSRPHTIIGTAISVCGLFVVVVSGLSGVDGGAAAFHLFWTLVAGLSVNLFIVGINQLTDVEIDRVNKPFLPIAAGELSRDAALKIVIASAALPVVLALTQGPLELAAVLAALAVGTAYSVPPVRLKRHPLVASLCVSGVRSAIVNLGVAAHFTAALGGSADDPRRGVGADRVRAPVQPGDRDPQGRPRRGRATAATRSPPTRCGTAAGG